MNNRIQMDLILKKKHISLKRNTLTNCFCNDCLKNGKLATFVSFLEVFDSNFNILNVLNQFSLKITMHYRGTLFYCIVKYF